MVGLVQDLENQTSNYTQQRNEMINNFNETYDNYTNICNNENTQGLINNVTAPYNTAGPDVADAIFNWRSQNATKYLLNATLNTQLCDMQYSDANNALINAQANYLQAVIACQNDTNNVTLQVTQNITDAILQSCYTRVAAANQSKIAAEQWYQQVLSFVNQILQAVKGGAPSWIDVASVKQQWIAAGVDNVTQQISNEIEAFSNNTTVDSCDFSDLYSSNAASLTLKVYLTANPLNSSDANQTLSNIKNIFGNCLVAEGIPPKAINVITYTTSKKRSATQVTAEAQVTNPTAPVTPSSGSPSSGSGSPSSGSVSGSGSADTTNTMPYVVGGVVGGLVVVAIIIVVIVVVLKKRDGEMV